MQLTIGDDVPQLGQRGTKGPMHHGLSARARHAFDIHEATNPTKQVPGLCGCAEGRQGSNCCYQEYTC